MATMRMHHGGRSDEEGSIAEIELGMENTIRITLETGFSALYYTFAQTCFMLRGLCTWHSGAMVNSGVF